MLNIHVTHLNFYFSFWNFCSLISNSTFESNIIFEYGNISIFNISSPIISNCLEPMYYIGRILERNGDNSTV